MKHIDPKEVACKIITNQSWRAAGTGAGEATGARMALVRKETVDGSWSERK
jgi:hypothetical protein